MSRLTSVLIALALVSLSFSQSELETIGVDSLSFANTFIFGLTNENLTSCYPPSFLQYTGANTTLSNIETNPFQNSTSELKTILGYISKGVSDVCSIKSYILKLLDGRSPSSVVKSVNSDASQTNSYIQKFQNLQTPAPSRRFLWWWDDVESAVSSVGSDISSAASSVGSDISSAANTVGGAISSAANTVASDVKNVVSSVGSDLQKVFGDVVTFGQKAVSEIETLAQKVENFIASGIEDIKSIIQKISNLVSNAKSFYNSGKVQTVKNEVLQLKACATNLVDAVKDIKSLITKFEKTITTIETTGAIGIAKFAFSLICEFQSFVPAVEALIHGINSSGQVRMEDFGYFLGKFIEIIGNA